LSIPRVTVVVPTLAADESLEACLHSLATQTLDGVEVIVVDNSGHGRLAKDHPELRVIANTRNVGFGAAINQGFHQSSAPYLATLNDDAIAHPEWLEALVGAMESRPDVGMCASRIRRAGEDRLDSAGMLMAGDGSGKQRGHGEPCARHARLEEVLFPSGAAALYRREALEEAGLFDEAFFLYCEDVDLGLRARWKGWECLYVPEAEVEHHYSRSAGAASPLKAWYVERNRVAVVLKDFPLRMICAVPGYVLARYFWHVLFMFRRRGKAAEFRAAGHSPWALAGYVVRAHIDAARRWRSLWKDRQRIRRGRRLNSKQFYRLLRKHWISVRQVAAS
jgi:GT2 family glycosyltransferase